MERVPRYRDKVYCEDRRRAGDQPNGFIASIDWDAREIVVQYYNNNNNKGSEDNAGDQESYSFEDIDGMWRTMFGGTWFLCN